MQEKIIDKLLPPLILGAMTCLVYWSWFAFPGAIYTFGDWPYFFLDTMMEIRSNYNTIWLDDYNFGRVLQDVSQAPTYSFYGILAKTFSINFAEAEKIVHFYPAAILNSLTPFVLYRYLLNSSWGALAGAIVYAFSTPTLTNNTGHLTLSVSFGLLPIVLYFAIRSIERDSTRSLLFAICLTQLAIFYEIRGALIIICCVLIYFTTVCLCAKTKKLYKKIIFLSAVYIFFIFALNLYWLISLFYAHSYSDLSIIHRGIFGKDFYDLLHAVFVVHPFWSDGKLVYFMKSELSIRHAFIPIFASLGIYLSKDNQQKIAFLILLAIGILLTKLATRPASCLYDYLFEFIPGFSIYREPSKFYELTILSYGYFIATFAVALRKRYT